jgi:hypothetical protein
LQWFAAPEADVVVSLRTVCDALDLPVKMVQAIAMQLAQQPMALRHQHSRG